MKHEMTLYDHKGKVCLEQNIPIGSNGNILFQTHLHFVTQDDADNLECIIGCVTSLYLVMISPHKMTFCLAS